MEHDDENDIREAVAGSNTAFERLMRRHGPAIHAAAGWYAQDPAEREALVQDVFVEAFLGLAGFRGAGSFAGWLKTILTRLGRRLWRLRKKNARWLPLPEHWQDTLAAPESVDSAKAGEALFSLLALLPEKDRLALTLFYGEGCDTREIAARTGWTRGGVMVRCHRARRRLKELARRHGLEGDWT